MGKLFVSLQAFSHPLWYFGFKPCLPKSNLQPAWPTAYIVIYELSGEYCGVQAQFPL